MAFNVIDGFTVSSANPADLKSILSTSESLFVIPSYYRYDGMSVYCQNDKSTYKLIGGVADVNWIKISTGSFSYQCISASYAPGSPSISASYALTASYALNAGSGGGGGSSLVKSGNLTSLDFLGTPLVSTVTFTTPFDDDQYSITIMGEDPRTWTYYSKTSSSFVINSNSNELITGEVSWQAIHKNINIDFGRFRAGLVSGSLFSGVPLKYVLILDTPLPNTNYSVIIGGEDPRTWTYSQKTTGSFIINSNSNIFIDGMVSWQAIMKI